MTKTRLIFLLLLAYGFMALDRSPDPYRAYYLWRIDALDSAIAGVRRCADTAALSPTGIQSIKKRICYARLQLKAADIWLRYLDPLAYKRINGPLRVEWENEVFEKYEPPYRREGTGLSLAELYLGGKTIDRDTLRMLIAGALPAMATYRADSTTAELMRPGNLLLCNRLYLLNLAGIYTTGFECPDDGNVIPELAHMMKATRDIYNMYNRTHSQQPIGAAYLALYDSALAFVQQQGGDYRRFDHYTFIRTYINRLFAINQALIRQYHTVSKSYNDYSISNEATAIFDKQLYTAQNALGLYSLVTDSTAIREIVATGKKLFYDPILSGNNERSCASCHKPTEYFTDTSRATAEAFGHGGHLDRNTPTLLNALYQHLLMLDGRHLSLQAQAQDVITNAREMGGTDTLVLQKVMSCKEYRTTFRRLLRYTPEEKEVTLRHIISAVTAYYAQFSNYYSPFDESMLGGPPVAQQVIDGFNIFMGKAQCGTCHYVPQFAGVPPPYINSEFEVTGTPADTGYHQLSADKGRYTIHPAPEMLSAFRVPTVRNAAHTMPYMHNGIFGTMQQLIGFYDGGGGAGHGLAVPNQTLATDSLRLTAAEQQQLIAFIRSLDERIIFDTPPQQLPSSSDERLNARKPGGIY